MHSGLLNLATASAYHRRLCAHPDAAPRAVPACVPPDAPRFGSLHDPHYAFHPSHGAAARRVGDVRPVFHRHHLPGVLAAQPQPGGGRGGDPADHQRLSARLRADEHRARPAVRCLGPQAGDPGRAGAVHRRLGGLRAVAGPAHPAGIPRAAGAVGRGGHDRRAGGDPRPVPGGGCATADEPGVDDLRHRPGDRADHRRLDPAQRCRLAADLLVPGSVRAGAAGGHADLAAGDPPAGGAHAAATAPPDARLRADRLQPAFPAAGGGLCVQLRRHLPVHRCRRPTRRRRARRCNCAA